LLRLRLRLLPRPAGGAEPAADSHAAAEPRTAALTSAVGEIYRYELKGEGRSLNEIKAVQDWFVRRELKQVPGIIDVTTFGGTTKQYQAELDPQRLLQYNV